MRTDVVTVAATGSSVAHGWCLRSIGGLPVTSEGLKLIGIVTAGDLPQRVEDDADRNRSLLSPVFARPERWAAEFDLRTVKFRRIAEAAPDIPKLARANDRRCQAP